MGERRAAFQVVVGPNEGDVLHVERGACRLVGRHLSDNETVLMDPDGNRELDAAAAEMLQNRLSARREAGAKSSRKSAEPAPRTTTLAPPPKGASPYARGPDIILTDGAISRAHAMLFVDAMGAGIVDLASTNGTYVNNKRVASTMLEDGDVIVIGSSEIAVTTRGS